MGDKQNINFLCVLVSFLLIGSCWAIVPYDRRPEVQQFIAELSAEGFNKNELNKLFHKTNHQAQVVGLFDSPGEAQPWYRYRGYFVTSRQIENGKKYWKKHARVLQQVSDHYGVPAEIIVAIIGVETNYGTIRDHFRVMDTLSTLAFDQSKRAEFFTNELKEYLLLCREENLVPLKIKGSYAGAIGKPQFMPSSYRQYAVDWDNDGHCDLLHSDADSIASVANYLKQKGWHSGELITIPAKARVKIPKKLLRKGLKPQWRYGYLRLCGINTTAKIPYQTPVRLMQLQGKDGTEYWLGLNNFYIITLYNRSTVYAMAVYQLAEEIKQAIST